MFSAAATWLERNIDYVNAINVFPVPDGDTGTNMYLTMRSIVEEANHSPGETAGEMLSTMSQGALMGARGNSGVILSQIMHGLSKTEDPCQTMDSYKLVSGLERGANQAYSSVTNPVEGTILTVIRDVAEAARESLTLGTPSLISVMEASVAAAKRSVAKTQTMLPELAKAGVVDAGGQGLFLILEGMTRYLRGEPMPKVDTTSNHAIQEAWLNSTNQIHMKNPSPHKYCTEFLVRGDNLDTNELQASKVQLGDSVLVVGNDDMIRVHIHTNNPNTAISYGAKVGSLSDIKIDNIQEQTESFLGLHMDDAVEESTKSAVIVVASGSGLSKMFLSIGATSVIHGGQTMNPSTNDIVKVIESCIPNEVIILPNNKNVIMAAEQARELTKKRVHVVPTISIPQGVAALLAITSTDNLLANVKAMDDARSSVQTVEVCRATRNTTAMDVKIKAGQAIALVDDKPTEAANTPNEALINTLASLPLAETSLITVYYGADTNEDQANILAKALTERFSDHELEVVYGGQPYYNYIASLE